MFPPIYHVIEWSLAFIFLISVIKDKRDCHLKQIQASDYHVAMRQDVGRLNCGARICCQLVSLSCRQSHLMSTGWSGLRFFILQIRTLQSTVGALPRHATEHCWSSGLLFVFEWSINYEPLFSWSCTWNFDSWPINHYSKPLVLKLRGPNFMSR